MYKIISDTSCDLSKEEIKELIERLSQRVSASSVARYQEAVDFESISNRFQTPN